MQGWALRSAGAAWIVGLLCLPLEASAGVNQPCRVDGIPNEVQCGSVRRALDPARADGPQIEVHYLVVPAMARNKRPDAVLVLAGGPGQSAINLAPLMLPGLARLNNQRDLVFIDQRGTGQSAPLQCPEEKHLPLQEAASNQRQLARLKDCLADLRQLPHGDLRHYTTPVAMQDMEAVRVQLGYTQWNLIGASYGTRAALEYQRQFPAQVRRTVLDGVAPPDMALPASFSQDGQAALDALFQACEGAADAGPAAAPGNASCARQFPQLRQRWQALLASLPRTVQVTHPVTGVLETVTLERDVVLRAVRLPLYSPALAAALPYAIHEAAQGRFTPLLGLGSSFGSSRALRLATGMHFSVVCAEDLPRMQAQGAAATPGSDFGDSDARWYRSVCDFWPRAEVDPAFYTVPTARAPVLLLSGGADPATPARHGARVARALGSKALHVVVAQAGHGVLQLGCMREVVARFITAREDAQALAMDAQCAVAIPRPPPFVPVQPAAPQGKHHD